MKKKSNSLRLKMISLSLAAALISSGLLSGCGKTSKKQDDGINDTGSVSTELTSASGSDTSEDTGAPSENINELSDKAERISDNTKLFDLSPLISGRDDMLLMDIAARDDGKVLLLYESSIISGAKPVYSVDLLDPASGEITSIADNRELISNGTSEIYNSLSFVSLNPVILYDASQDRLYDIESDVTSAIEVPENHYIIKLFPYNDMLYILWDTGMIYYFEETADGFEPVTAWKPQNTLKFFDFVEQKGSLITVTAYSVKDDKYVYLDIDISSGEVKDSYTLAETSPENKITSMDSATFTCNYIDDAGMTFYLRTSGNTMYSFCPSGDSDKASGIRNNLLPVNAGYFSASDSGLFMILGDEDSGYTPAYWIFSDNEKTSFEEPSKTPVTVIDVDSDYIDEYIGTLNEKYDISILTDMATMPEVPEYNIIPEDDAEDIYDLLKTLDELLSVYPDGFIKQLGEVTMPLRICIVNDIKGGKEDNTVDSAAGLVNSDIDGNFLYLSTYDGMYDKSTFYHEMMHIIYNKINESMDYYFVEDEWNTMNPEGFSYGSSYNPDDLPSTDYTSNDYFDNKPDNVYFITAYSKTYMTEDVADLMGYLMGPDDVPSYYSCPHLQQKCRYIFDKIRTYYDTTGWPEKTFWEERLDSVAE